MVSNQSEYLNQFRRSRSLFFDSCKRYKRKECESQVIFTQILSKNALKFETNSRYEFFYGKSSMPSLNIESKAKIDTVDLITYIFGALGIWIGFSFIQLNPVPHLLSVPRKKEFDAKKHFNKNNRLLKCVLRHHREQIDILALQIISLKRQIIYSNNQN